MKGKRLLVLYLKKIFVLETLISIIRHYQLNRKYKKQNVRIGFDTIINDCVLNDYVWIGSNCQLNNCAIGKHSYLGTYTKAKNVKIGAFCSIAGNVSLGLGKHPTNMISTHPAFYSNSKPFQTFADKNYIEEYGSIEIGNDVWIGSQVAVMFGVKIGDGAIIAYGSVVTKDVEPYSIVGGVPAKHIKYRFDKDTINNLLDSKWWSIEDSILRNSYHCFHDIDSFQDDFFKRK